MKAYATESIRNLAVIGHGDVGKTQLISSLLYVAGATPRWGKVEEGTTVTDYEEDSIARKITLNTALAHLEHRDTKVNFIDTPGYAAFVAHARPAIRIADCGMVVVDGVKGVEVQTEKAWDYANEFLLPRIMVVTKLDKEHSDIGIALDSAHNLFKRAIVPFTLPIGKEQNFKGVVDVVHLKAYQFDENGKAKEIEIPSEGRDVVDKTRERLIELVAESDDALMEKYFDQGTLEDSDVLPNIGKAIANSKLCPVFAVSTTTLVGLATLLDHIIEFAPNPGGARSRAWQKRKRRTGVAQIFEQRTFFGLLFPHHCRSFCRTHQRDENYQRQSRQLIQRLQFDARCCRTTRCFACDPGQTTRQSFGGQRRGHHCLRETERNANRRHALR